MLHAAVALVATVAAFSDSTNARWHARPDAPVQVFVSASSTAPDWNARYVESVRRAFREWNAVGLPVQFAFTDDSLRAVVHVVWTDRFDGQRSGQTRTVMDDSARIMRAGIVMAVHHPDGRRLGVDEMRVLAMHEVGHALGLDHVSGDANIMSETVRVRALSARDRAVALEHYARPAR